MLENWGMQSTPSLQSLLRPLCPGVVAPESVLSISQREQLDYVQQMTYAKLNCLK